ncbi:MAG: acyclic terpene utilization AtuA family protein [Proteobacteria bacterium]|nr:acyclic terpene utilization AtuA family protein [Pseudomonadota bacterium]
MSTRQRDEIRILAPNGVIGSGFREESFEEGLGRRPHFIGVDGGTTDAGPYYLGAGTAVLSADSVKADLRIIVRGARRLNIPLLIGSCGTAGGDVHLAWMFENLRAVAAEESLSLKVALIHAEQDKDYLKRKLRDGRIRPLDPAPPFDEGVIDRSERIVGMMGVEPYLRALEGGADVVLAGRSSDTAIFAGIPIREGYPEGLAWHAAKILECGAAAVVHRKHPDCMLATIRRDHFVIEPLNPEFRCTPQTVAAHTLYENADPFFIVECSGTMDLRESVYEALDDRMVRVSCSGFIPAATYTVKLEGVEKVGYQSVIIGGIRDPLLIRQIDDWLGRLQASVRKRVRQVYRDRLSDNEYVYRTHVYGKNGVMGALEPVKEIRSHELGVVFEVTASSQEIANSLALIIRHQALHLPIPEWSGMVTNLACLYNPAYLERGAVYRFNVNHVVEPDDPLEMFPIEPREIG